MDSCVKEGISIIYGWDSFLAPIRSLWSNRRESYYRSIFTTSAIKVFVRERHWDYENRGLKWSIVLGIILASLILPIGASNEDLTTQMQIDNTWHKFERDKIKTYVDQGKIIFVNITADWCVSCKYNNLMVLNRDKTMKLFQEYAVHAMKGDFSSHNQEIYDYIVANGSYGIPFYKIYGPKKPQGLVLPIIISYSDIKLAIREVW